MGLLSTDNCESAYFEGWLPNNAPPLNLRRLKMLIVRLSKILMVAAMAFFATLGTFGNITDYSTNFAFVRHVLSMDTIFSDSTINTVPLKVVNSIMPPISSSSQLKG